MEKYTANTRFCIIANYTHKLSPALLSRCTRFRFSPLKEADIRKLVEHVIEAEDVNIGFYTRSRSVFTAPAETPVPRLGT